MQVKLFHIMNTHLSGLTLVIIVLLMSCSSGFEYTDVQAAPVSHELWHGLLQKHVDKTGKVNYKGFIKDKTILEDYLKLLSTNPPSKTQSEKEKLAYWINAYNAFTVKLIVDYYPVKSIKDIGPRISLPFINSVWDIKFFEIGGKKMDLNHIEHSILRKEFNEPRIHFAIVCASESCPALVNEAFVADKLESQLDNAAISFINDTSKNKITSENAGLSSIFSWFKGDFTKNGTLIAFINKYSKTKISENAKINYIDYNWNLNE